MSKFEFFLFGSDATYSFFFHAYLFQHDLVDHVQGSYARFLLNQGVSDFALRDIRINFQDKYFGNKINHSISLAYCLLKGLNFWNLHLKLLKQMVLFLIPCNFSSYSKI